MRHRPREPVQFGDNEHIVLAAEIECRVQLMSFADGTDLFLENLLTACHPQFSNLRIEPGDLIQCRSSCITNQQTDRPNSLRDLVRCTVSKVNNHSVATTKNRLAKACSIAP